jgi:hypothetical protein
VRGYTEHNKIRTSHDSSKLIELDISSKATDILSWTVAQFEMSSMHEDYWSRLTLAGHDTAVRIGRILLNLQPEWLRWASPQS